MLKFGNLGLWISDFFGEGGRWVSNKNLDNLDFRIKSTLGILLFFAISDYKYYF